MTILRTTAVTASILLTAAVGACGSASTKRVTNRSHVSAQPGKSGCFVLPGSGEGRTRSYRVLPTGLLEPAGEVTGDAHHMRAAFHPDGRHVYVTTLTQAGEQRYGIHLRTFRYDLSTCSIGPLLSTARMGADTASITRVYGLEVHPSGRWLYQTTASVRKIHRFRLGDNRIPVLEESYDVTQGGTLVCAQTRRLAIHPDGRTLYSNCNNADFGPGGDLALQAWDIGADGALSLRQHYALVAMNGGITDPVLHPSGRWLYQPVGTADPSAPHGRGAYILTFAVMPDGTLRRHATTPVRILTPMDSLHEMEMARTREDSVRAMWRTQTFPITLNIHPDGSVAYAALHVMLEARTFPHEFVRLGLDSGGSRLLELDRRPPTLETRYSSHHGGTLVTVDGATFLYSYLTDYDTTRGGVLQQFRIGPGHELIPLDPPYVATKLRDARQPIPAPSRRGSVP